MISTSLPVADARMLYVAMGRYRIHLCKWMNESQTNIYVTPLVTSSSNSTSTYTLSKRTTTEALVWITGETDSQLKKAKDTVSKALSQIANRGGHTQILDVPMRSVEFLHRFGRDKLEHIMRKFGRIHFISHECSKILTSRNAFITAVHITTTIAESQNVSILGMNSACVERAVKHVMDEVVRID